MRSVSASGNELAAWPRGVRRDLRDRIIGRVSLDDIKGPIEGSVIIKSDEEIGEETANAIQSAGIEKVRIRSVLSCESARGVRAVLRP